jgi:NAD(P)H-flavin reductase
VAGAVERAGDGPAWWPAEVIEHHRAGEGVAILTVRPWRRLPFQPGQAVPVSTERWPGRWRWYSPANAPRPDGTLEFHVRAVAAVSRALVHAVRPGDPLWLGPPGDTGLRLDPTCGADLLLAAGGTGLAPLRALVEQVAAAPPRRRVTLVVGSRTFADLYDAISLDKLQCAHDWLTVVPALSHDVSAEPAEQGDALTLALYHYRAVQEVYVCGPLDGYGVLAQQRWAVWRRRHRLDDRLPEDFDELLQRVFALADPAVTGLSGGQTWIATASAWRAI